MKPVAKSGDLTLTAKPATPETFTPFGQLLIPGTRAHLGGLGGALISVDSAKPGARRVTHLERYPEALRVVFAPGAGALWILVLGPGDPPTDEPVAFLIPKGCAIVLAAGVWHSGPRPLGEGVVVELLETPGVADRLDRRPMGDLTHATGVRVVLPEEAGPTHASA